MLPKDHKTPLRGRPLVSAVDTAGTTLAKILAECLKPMLDFIPTHLKDTIMFITAINSVPLEDYSMFHYGSFDVSNLYGSIPLTGNDNVFSISAEFFESHKNTTCFRQVSCEDFAQLTKLAVLSDTIVINNTMWNQNRGLAMGNNFSPWLAIVYMYFIEQKIYQLDMGAKLILWRRYIDDIFVISQSPLDIFLPLINSISSDIKFTLEVPNLNNKLPFLDTMVTCVVNNNILTNDQTAAIYFSTSLYVKPTHSNHILPWSSFVPLQRKIALLKTERIRTQRICSTHASFVDAIKVLKKKFILNGYPEHIIDQFFTNGAQHRQHRVRYNNNNKIIYMKFPYLGESYENKVRQSVRQANLPVHIRTIFTTEPPLSVQLRRGSNIPCGNGCVCNGRSLCHKKNIVYEITCTICNAKYVGETHRTLRTRIREHLTTKQSNVFQHFNASHSIPASLLNINIKILAGGFSDSSHRISHEAELIKKEHPNINVQFPNL